MTRVHQPCPSCDSSDALVEYADGHSYCFSCRKTTFPSTEFKQFDNDGTFVSWRGITEKTMEFFDVRFDGTWFHMPHGSRTLLRARDEKAFKVIGNGEDLQLFGMNKFTMASSKAITITEGAIDAMSWYQMSGSRYPTVSVMSAASAKRDCQKHYNYLNSFSAIYLMMDNDPPGKNAAKEVARMFDVNKVYMVEF